MRYAVDVAVSPDGENVYLAARDSNAAAAFATNESGALHQLAGADACVSEGGTEGCAAGFGLAGAFGIAVSPDGKNVYVASKSNAVAVFRRKHNGALTQLSGDRGCVGQQGPNGCATADGIGLPLEVTVSGDGKSAYVSSWRSRGVAAFARTKR